MVSKIQWIWSFILVLCIASIGGALFYQYALQYEPCELCIYVRLWIIGIALTAVLGLLVHPRRWCGAGLLLLVMLLAIGMGFDVWTLLAIDYNWKLDGACSFQAQFPSWAPLDTWLPSMFEVRNLCTPTPLLLFGISMADALAVATVSFLLLALYGLMGISRTPS